ncbi:MAG: GTPase HflX [Bacilli bacterium]
MYDVKGRAEPERAFLMHVFDATQSMDEREHARAELVSLVEAAGAVVVGSLSQVVEERRPGTLIGKGKLDELAQAAQTEATDVIVFGVELSGGQLRNVEEAFALRVIDRTQLILDIFAARARSFEGKAQVRLAQLSYMLPRLIGHGAEMSRLGGGIGTRGPGETKLEIDRRTIRKEIADLRALVAAEGERRRELRRRRERQGVYSVGIVGYTNAGKTTLLSHLAGRFGEKRLDPGRDRLFDTLDLTVRRATFAGRTFVFTDTVGFIRDLPHHLVDAFRATLQEAVDADMLVHVVDSSSPFIVEEMETVYGVLQDTHAAHLPVVTFFNKSDQAANAPLLTDSRAAATVVGSAMNARSVEELLEHIDLALGRRVALHLMIPHGRSDVLAQAYRVGRVDSVRESDACMLMDVRVDQREAWQFAPFSALGDESLLERTLYDR